MSKLLPDYWSHSNPVDMVATADANIHLAILEELLKWDECDSVIQMGSLGQIRVKKALLESTVALDSRFAELADMYLNMQVDFENQVNEQTIRLMEKYQKPVIGVYSQGDENSHTVTEIENCQYKGINFTLPEKAVKALAWMYQYVQWLQKQ